MALAAVVVCVGGPALAAVPQATTVEGALTTTGGGPVADGAYDLTFALYTEEVGGEPVWTEGPTELQVTGGLFHHRLGSVVALDAATVAQAGFLTVQVGSEPAMARKPLTSVVQALRASGAATITCSGCIAPEAVKADDLAIFAKSSSLAKLAKSGDYADVDGAVDVSIFAKTADLAAVAFSGAYSDVQGTPDLGALALASDLQNYAKSADLGDYAKTADLHAFATSGSYADLSGTPTLPVVGKACGTNLVVAGFTAEGELDCVQGTPAKLEGDDLSVVSNGAMTNVFVDTVSSAKVPLAIPDNNPVGVYDSITVPDLGLAQKLTVSIKLANSDISGLTINLFDPNNTLYKLYDKGAKSGGAIDTSYPTPTLPVSGDLTTWVGKNPKGNWFLQVIDTKFTNNTTDGAVSAWSVQIQTMSNKKIEIAGDLIIDGKLTLGLGGLIPAGAVISYNGAACPSGWVLADGTNNNPDLRGRIPIGVGNLPYGGAISLKATGGSNMWRMYGGDGSGAVGRQWGYRDTRIVGMQWQGESEVTVSRGTSWTGYVQHLPPYVGLLYCVKQ